MEQSVGGEGGREGGREEGGREGGREGVREGGRQGENLEEKEFTCAAHEPLLQHLDSTPSAHTDQTLLDL